MSVSQSANMITTAWAGIVPLENQPGFLIYGCKPGKRLSLGVPPVYVTARGATPMQAYQRLTRLTRHAWCVAVRESDLINTDGVQWTQMVHGIPKIKMISDQLWTWAEPIWDEAQDDLPASLDRSRALWLALTAAHDEELRLAEEVPF